MKKKYVRPMVMSELELMDEFILAGSQSPWGQSKEFIVDEIDETDEDIWSNQELETWKDE